ncbi:MAG: 3-deoxy-7-phosphoheptulonate synthase, partial [Gemmatimonadota bacterium]
MLVVMRRDASLEDVERVVAAVQRLGFEARPIPGRERTTIGIVGNEGRIDGARVSRLPGVEDVIHVTPPFKQVSREWRAEPTVVRLGEGVAVGGGDVVVMAGPCSVESEGQILET